MGQNPNLDDDWEGLERLASLLEKWATAISLGNPITASDEHGVLHRYLTDGGADTPERVIVDVPGLSKPRFDSRPFHDLVGECVAETFAAEVRIVPNLNAESPYCLEVRFKYARVPPRYGKRDPLTVPSEAALPPLVLPVSAADRFIYLRVNKDGSGVDNREVRSSRRALGGYLEPDRLDDPVIDLSGDSSVRDITWQTGTVPRSRCIYWNDECPSEDLRAQLLIAMAQLGVIQVDERLTTELGRYLRKNFGPSISWAVRRHRLSGRQVADAACAQILQNYSFPEHPHGFRLYVGRVLRWPLGQGEAEFQPDFDPVKESYTIPEAAYHLAVSRDTLYRLIRKGELHAQPGDDEMLRIPRVEFLKVAANRLVKVQRKERCRELQDQHGMSPDAARKAVYRSRRRLPSIGTSTKDTVR